MDRPPDPPGPESPTAVIALMVMGSALVPLGRVFTMFSFTTLECEATASLPPDLLSGLVCGLVSAAVVALPLWVIAGAPRQEAVETDGEEVTWRRSRLPPGLLAPLVVAGPVLAGLLAWGLTPRAAGTSCTVLDFDRGMLEGETRAYDGLGGPFCAFSDDPAVRALCVQAAVPAGAVLGALTLAAVAFGVTARRRRRDVGTLELDARGLVLDQQRFAWGDLDALSVTPDGFTVQPYDGPPLAVRFRPWEQAFGRWFAETAAAHVRPAGPDDPEARAALASLRTSREVPAR